MGASLAAFSIERLLIPNQIIDRGVIGIPLILDYLIPDDWLFLNFATLVILLNAPLMYFGYKQIGKTFMLSSIVGILFLAIAERFFTILSR
ncbi:hypothetical protein PspKH34_10560 [Parageobacillus sp. KH3-4]|nr:hypothetical protein PspKH34_10560 [Parageobacillus sp. KH3-4]